MEIPKMDPNMMDQLLTRPDNQGIDQSIEQVKKLILTGKLTPFYPPTDTKTYSNPIQCPICYSYFPMINVLRCCNNHLCSACLLAASKQKKCPFCRSQQFEWYSNIPPTEISNDDEKDDVGYQRRDPNLQLPDDIKDVCKEFGFDEKEVFELFKQGLQISRLVEQE